jgi:acyl-CoA thioester hydrolase
MTEILAYRGAVYPWHCDHMGHMNIMWYVGKFDEANWNVFARCGVTPDYLRPGEFGMAGVQQNLTYRRELMAGDIVEVRSRVLEVRDRVLRLQHVMYEAQSGEVAAICELTAVHMDRKARRSCPFPAAIRALAKRLVEDATAQPAAAE